MRAGASDLSELPAAPKPAAAVAVAVPTVCTSTHVFARTEATTAMLTRSVKAHRAQSCFSMRSMCIMINLPQGTA
eukprot:6181075-Pleurochrysis_carterae.AAC.1